MRALLPPLFLVLAAGCGGASNSEGLDLWLRVRGAQLVRGEMPAPNGGPSVTQVELQNARVFPGEPENRVQGRVSGDGYAVLMGLEGDPGYWIRSVSVPDDAVPGELQWFALLDFSRQLPPGAVTLKLQATEPGGKVGEVRTVTFNAVDPTPTGELVITLQWDQPMDADLYVVDPSGVMLSPKNINTVQAPAPGAPQLPPGAYANGGYLDYDSNAQCVIDGFHRESAIYPSSSSFRKGRYQVFVGVSYPCGVARSAFTVTARRLGEVISVATGALYDTDARGSALNTAASPGLLAMELEIQ